MTNQTPAAAEKQFGYNNDYVGVLPHPSKKKRAPRTPRKKKAEKIDSGAEDEGEGKEEMGGGGGMVKKEVAEEEEEV